MLLSVDDNSGDGTGAFADVATAALVGVGTDDDAAGVDGGDAGTMDADADGGASADKNEPSAPPRGDPGFLGLLLLLLLLRIFFSSAPPPRCLYSS